MPVRFQVDPDFYDHPKTLGMSDAATALWVRAGSYSAAKLTDGFVSDDALVLLSRTPRDCARELIRRGLWSRVKGGYIFHQWGDRNLLRARVEAERASDAQRKRRERQQAQQDLKAQLSAHSVRPDGGPDSNRSPPGIRGLSVSVSESVSVSGRESPSAADGALGDPEPLDRCRDHRDDPDPPSCRRCRDARQRRETWHATNRARLAAEPRCRVHPAEIAANCRCCAADRKAYHPAADAA